ncbi:MAG: hypothetical protein U0263_28345 [Polyangiaceae bacterium]
MLYSGDLVAWIKNEDLHISVVKPKDGETLKALVSREWTYVVDLKTMKIVWKGFGSYDGSVPSSAEQGMTELLKLLGK